MVMRGGACGDGCSAGSTDEADRERKLHRPAGQWLTPHFHFLCPHPRLHSLELRKPAGKWSNFTSTLYNITSVSNIVSGIAGVTYIHL